MSTTADDLSGATTNGAAPPYPAVARRLGELRNELRAGRERLLECEAEGQRIRETMLRIEGAIMALEELEGDGAASPAVAG